MAQLHEEHEVVVDLEEVACELCGANERREVVSRTDLFLGGKTLYYMHECQGCGAIYQHPRPSPASMGTFYPSDYQQYTPGVHTEHWLRRLDRRYGLHKRCNVVTRHVKQGRLLDVGCATGDFLSEMKRRVGWTVVGIEPSASAVRYVHDQVEVEVVQGVLNETPFADSTFDAITMWDVLEHVYAPAQVIKSAARLLRPGGVLVVNHPNLDSIDRRLFGRFWLGYELPRHLYLFPSQLLGNLMAEHGLYEVERRCIYGSHAASSTSVSLMVETYMGKGRMSRAIRRLLFSKLTRILLVPYFWAIDQRRIGSNVNVVFKRLA